MNLFVLHNPHSYWYKPTVHRHFNEWLDTNKYEYIFDCLYKEKKVFVYLDDSTLYASGKARKKFWRWVFLNGLNPFKFHIIESLEQLDASDILFGFQYAHFNDFWPLKKRPDVLIAALKSCKALKVFHLTHYGFGVELAAQFSREAGIDLFVFENNLTKNSAFFRHYYGWYKKDVYALPFVVSPRFKQVTSFEKRQSLALATGSISPPVDVLKVFFGSPGLLHPMRSEIYENREALKDIIQCNIGLNIINIKENYVTDNAILRAGKYFKKKMRKLKRPFLFFLKSFCSYFGINRFRPPKSKAKQYDIVAAFNEYKIAIVAEEIIGAPAISFAESMACGCAFIGLDDPMYSDLGMRAGEHYIGYDGTLPGLTEKLRYYLSNEQELEKIAERGHEFALENFAPEKVMNNFMQYCRKAAGERA